MFIQQLFEGEIKRVIAIYPGRFQPFHLGHKEVFETLQAKFGTDNVFIGTSNKTDAVKSPFNFSDKLQLMTAAGVNNHHVIEVSSPYMPDDYIRAIGFDPTETVLIFAVGAPDLKRLEVDAHYTALTPTGRPSKIPDGKSVGDPKPFKTFKNLQDCETADQHQYVLIVNEREKKVTVNGKDFDASHGTQVRALWNEVRNDPKASAQVLQQLYGRATPEIAHIFNKIPDANAVPAPAPAAAPKLKTVKQPLPAKDLSEFAPPGSGDDGNNGFSDETLKRLAAQWWQGDEDPRVEQTLAAAGWEIGQDEGYDNGGVFVVQAGDINGNSYISWPAEELESLAEDAAGVGVIANKKQKNDPRYSMSMTKDVGPGEDKKNMKKLHLEGNRGYAHGFASPTAPSLGQRGREDDEYHVPDPAPSTWYIRANGKIIKDKMGTPFQFRDKEAARKAAMTMMSKPFNAGKKFVLTVNPEDEQGMAEGMFGIDNKIKGRIQNIVSELSDVPGYWDWQRDTFTPYGVEALASALKNNKQYIKYALSLTSDDYYADDLKEQGVAEATGPITHRIGLTVTDPNHPMVSKRGETYHKTVRVTGDDREKAINGAIAHARRKGYKVHDHHYLGTVDQGIAEATGDPKFDKMLKGITGKRQVAKQQKADTKQQARDAFGGMFGGGNPADKLSIRKKGVAEGATGAKPGWMLKQDPALAKKVKDSKRGHEELKKWAGKPVPKDDKQVGEGTIITKDDLVDIYIKGVGKNKMPIQKKIGAQIPNSKVNSFIATVAEKYGLNPKVFVYGPSKPMAEGKHFKTAYGWAGGSKPGGGTYKHPDQIKADREAKKKSKEQEQQKNKQPDVGVAEGKKPDNYHIVNKDGKPASLASYADRASAVKDRDAKHPGAEVRQVGPRGKVKSVSEGIESMTPNWAKYVLDQIYNSDGTVTLTDLFDEGIPGLHDMFMDIAQQHGLDPEEEFEEVQHELTLELEDLIKGGHDIDETGLGLDHKRNRFKSLHVSENAEELNIGDPVIITGQGIEFEGKTGDIDSFGEGNRFVVVDLYNHGRHSFHSSDVSYNDHADKEDDLDEDLYQYDKEDPYNSEFAPRAGMGRMTLRGWKQSLIRRTAELAQQMSVAGQDIDKAALWDHVYAKLKSMNMDPIAQEIEQAQAELEKIRQRGGIRSRAFGK